MGCLLTISRSDVLEQWTFRDGTSVNEELKDLDLTQIQAVCSQQSRSGWVSIATRNRLYQFMAMSDEETQKEMRQKVLRMNDIDKEGSSINTWKAYGASSTSVMVSESSSKP